jgi:hypothetical protein
MKAFKVFLFIKNMKKLIIRNLKEFFEQDFNCQFKMLAQLENEIQNSDSIKECILIPYKQDGDAIFDLVKIDYLKKTVFTYQFTTTVA